MGILLYIVTGVYALAGIYFHLEVGWLFIGKYPEILGDFVPREYSVEGSICALLGVLLYVGLRARKGQRFKATFLYWALYAAMLVLFYRYISLHPVEAIHLVHYSILACLLGCCIDGDRSGFRFCKIVFIAGSVGCLDEIMQYLVIAPGHKYMDFGDYVVNMLGAIGGGLLFYGFHRAPLPNERPLGPVYKTIDFKVAAVVLSFIGVLWASGYLAESPPGRIDAGAIATIGGKQIIFMERYPGYLGSWLPHFVSGDYYALRTIEGLAALIFLYILFSTYDPRIAKALAERITPAQLGKFRRR